MNKEFVWDVQVMEEVEPFNVTTEVDSIAEAARVFEEQWGQLSVRYIRKTAVTQKISYEGYEPEDWQVS